MTIVWSVVRAHVTVMIVPVVSRTMHNHHTAVNRALTNMCADTNLGFSSAEGERRNNGN